MIALITNIKILKLWVRTLTLNKPPYIPIPFSRGLIYRLLIAMKVVKNKVLITTLENNMDLSRLKLTAFEIIRNINKDKSISLVTMQWIVKDDNNDLWLSDT